MAQKYKKMQLMGLSAEKNVLLPPSPVPYSKKNMLDIHTHRRENRFRALYSLTPPRGFRPEEGVFYSVGIHPWVEREYRQGLFCPWEELEALAARPEVRAVGEAGLDWARRPLPDFSPACLHELPSPGGAQRAESRRRSVELLERQALLAARVGKPLVLHCVKAVDDIVALHRRLRPDVPWILHGYRGNPQQAAQLVRRGLCLSLGERFHPGAAACIPADRLLLETDESLLPIGEILHRVALARCGAFSEKMQRFPEKALGFFQKGAALSPGSALLPAQDAAALAGFSAALREKLEENVGRLFGV